MEENKWNKIAKDYHEEIISPFFGNVINPLFDDIEKVKNKKDKNIAEFGCGLFYLCEYLATNFKTVHASDFSKKMLEYASIRAKEFKNVNLVKEDVRKINYNNKFDIVISVNAIIMPSIVDVKKSLKNIYNSLTPKGKLMMILPSMESVHYHGLLLLDRELEKRNEKQAYKIAKIKFEKIKYDFFLGLFKDKEDRQKFYYYHEIKYLFNKIGFKNIKIKKVKYPWGEDISDYEDFPNEEPLWDWYISAEK